ncbi:MAG: HAD-IA family hydrolase [Methylococcales bacterium]|nr:HAD-IA family hydrolase [Methylococcales bacterium]
MAFKLECVLFDLDGTLVDTAPDLIACLNSALKVHGFEAVDSQKITPYISHGAGAMIQQSNLKTDQSTESQILETMLSHYETNILSYGGFFDGIEETLDFIEQNGLKWGVITNKQKRFTEPLMNALNITQRCACIISGDTTSKSKPHPEPMLAGCQQAGVNPKNCVYIGDAKHDMMAGQSVNMKTLAAVYGYLTPDDRPQTWGAEALLTSPIEIKEWIKKAV